MTIFRQEVFENLKNRHYGEIFINTPVQYTFVTASGGFILLCLFLFLRFAEFREKTQVKGILDANVGVIHLYAKQPGILLKQYIKQGETIKKGEPLFLVSSQQKGFKKDKERQIFLKRKAVLKTAIHYEINQLQKLKPLLLKKYISEEDYHKHEEALLDLKNKQSLLKMDYLHYKQGFSYLIRATFDGSVSSQMIHEGQSVGFSKPIATFLPAEAFLEGILYVPVRQARFLKFNQAIRLRYDAYPYQQFGVGEGKVSEISQTVLTDALEEKTLSIKEPYYKAHIQLDHKRLIQTQKMLKPGMTFSAELLGRKKTVGRWLLDGLYGHRREAFK